MSDKESDSSNDDVKKELDEDGSSAPTPRAASSPAASGKYLQQSPMGYPGGRPPEGYYQHMYPPQGEGHPPAYPPPRGYESGPPPPPYGMPPHGYPMYYQPPMYPHYPGYPPPPMYGYPPHPDHMGYGRPPGGEDVHSGLYGKRGSVEDEDPDRHHHHLSHHDDDGDEPLGDEEGLDGDGQVTARLKTYIKPRIPTTQDVLDRRARKNAQSRARAAKLRLRVIEIEKKGTGERTDEERQIFAQYENRRQRKNDRSRERAMEKKEEIDRILAKPEKKRTKIEKQFLDNALSAKKRKNEGDRNRRQRLKQMGVPAKLGLKGAMARGAHLRPMHHYAYPPPYGGPHVGEIPMSPMPPMGHHMHHHPHMPSPGGFGSPGMMPPLGYPSPQRRGPPGHSGGMETPSKSGGTPMPYMPPGQGYDGHHGSPSDDVVGPGGHPAEIRQRQHADGSLSIQIGSSSDPSAGVDGSGGAYNLNDLLGDEAGEPEGSK